MRQQTTGMSENVAPPATIEQAGQVAAHLSDLGATAVFLFGSVAYGRNGHDLDMAFALPFDRESEAQAKFSQLGRQSWPSQAASRSARFILTCELLETEPEQFREATSTVDLDLFLLTSYMLHTAKSWLDQGKEDVFVHDSQKTLLHCIYDSLRQYDLNSTSFRQMRDLSLPT